MKKQWLVIAALLTTLTAPAATLLTEDFDYAQGEVLTDHSWFTQWGAASAISVTNGLNFEGYAGCGVGNAAVIDVAESNQLHKSFTQVTEGNLYVAFMFQPIMAYKEGYFFCLRDNKLDNQTYNFNARVFMNTEGQLGLTFAQNGNKIYGDEILDAAKTYVVVLKYTINEGSNNDAVSLYLLDTFSETEPAEPFIGPLTDAASLDINPANIVLRGYSADIWLVVDGIRVGTTWEDAVMTGVCANSVPNYSVNDSKIYVENGSVHFEVAEPNTTTKLYDMAGRCLRNEILAAGNHAIMLQKGCYILQLGNQIEKIVID